MALNLSQKFFPPIWLKGIALFGLIFGIITLFSGGSVLFGPESARISAGSYVPFVVWFNFTAGFFYIIAAIGVLLGKPWSCRLSVLIAAATAITAAIFAYYVSTGVGFEMRTVGALAVRAGFWSLMAFLIRRTLKG